MYPGHTELKVLVLIWFFLKYLCKKYSIVKDSSADLGVNFKIVLNRKAVCTKISKKFFFHFWHYFDISEKR